MPDRLITPPFRTALLTQAGAPFAGDGNDIQTTRDWWLYWQQLTDQGNSNSRMISHGSHGSRPLPDGMPDGAIYIDDDRSVIYQNWGGTWQYLAGTMYGTLSPDQRPTDLGTHDAGFEFRGTDQARQFIWSQTEWIEVTAVQYGPHALRPDPATIVEGALYVESDRGGAIYQRETPSGTPIWQYLAGTMFGTLSPDQRPTGLGTHDAGFDFRGTDQQREFIWSQTAWVEVASQLGDVQQASLGGDYTLTTANTALSASLALNRAGRYLITGDFVIGFSDPGIFVRGGLRANGVDQSKQALFSAGGIVYTTVSQFWVYTAATAGQTVALTAYKDSGTGGSYVLGGHTSITAQWINP